MKSRQWCKKCKRWHTKHAWRHCRQHKCGAKPNLVDGGTHCTRIKSQ